jgi:SagB-type dehydrogenase family enzyme
VGRNIWEVHNLLTKRTLKIDNYSVALLTMFQGGKEIDKVIEYFEYSSREDKNTILELIYELLEVDFLRDNLTELSSILETQKRWQKRGWAIAFEHHLATFNYPYLDYQEEGVSSDRGQMLKYYAQEPDLERFKASEGITEIECLPTNQALKNLASNFESKPRLITQIARIGLKECALIMSATFGITEWRGRNSSLASQTARRTSPSGGARHPSEGYLLNIEIGELETGLYHFNTPRSVLVKISDLPDDFDLERTFEALNISEIKPQAIVLFSTCPARNMYRYREPRTLRTIFMDIGHLAASAELVAESLGFKVFGHHGFDNSYLEKIASFDSELKESFIYMVAIEGSRSE